MLDSSKLLRDKIRDSAYKSTDKKKYAAAATKIKINRDFPERSINSSALIGGLPNIVPPPPPPPPNLSVRYSILTANAGGGSDPINAYVNLSPNYPTVWNGYSSGNYQNNRNINYTITFSGPCPISGSFVGGTISPGFDTFQNLEPFQSNGTWGLWIQDFAGGDQGTIANAVLKVTTIDEIVRSFSSNQSSIIIPDSGKSIPYPVTFTVSGITELTSGVEISINNYNHTYAGDVAMLLTSPSVAAS